MHDVAAQAIMDMANAGVIHANLPAPTGGATSPMTITGSLVQQSAETLAPLVLAQIMNPGCGVVYPRLEEPGAKYYAAFIAAIT